MPIKNSADLAKALHDAGVVNLDVKVSDVLRVAGVGDLDPLSPVASGAVAWDGYVIVYKGMPSGLSEIESVAKRTQRGGGV